MIPYTLVFNKMYLNEIHFLHNYKIIEAPRWNCFRQKKHFCGTTYKPKYVNIVWQYRESTLWVVLSEINI